MGHLEEPNSSSTSTESDFSQQLCSCNLRQLKLQHFNAWWISFCR